MNCSTNNESKAETQAIAINDKGNNRPNGIKPRGMSTIRDNKRDPGKEDIAKDMGDTTSRCGGMYGGNRCTKSATKPAAPAKACQIITTISTSTRATA